MVKNSVWIQQEIEGVKLYVYRSNVKDATTIYFLDGDQFEEPFNYWIRKHQPTLNFVLINANNRTNDYTPWPLQASETMTMDFGGKAAEHLAFITTKVIPFCESEYGLSSSAKKRAIGGYSLGGLFSLYAAVNTDLFGTVLSCSSSLWYPDFLAYLIEYPFKAAHPKLYMSVGDEEGVTATNLTNHQIPNTMTLKDLLEPKFQPGDFKFTLEEGNHGNNISGRAWRAIEWVEENCR
ncbi:alpha/beta hydrolase [Granulicatella adiacens]|uniref:alpha/beta hydrolase n=1 Tax=Granulicatella adiacens TaxID=46124 RepID=UPI00241DCD8B|nr:alpha/beta hydrolase-fold protein [Granulicatella adiacens]